MNRGIFTTTMGMVASQRAMDVTANNLANASTSGFKRDGLIFQDTLQREMYANGGQGPSVGMLGSGAQAVEEFTIRDIGVISSTGNAFDMAINSPEGMFAVKANGETRYTRDGAFGLDENRRLVSKTGFPVLDKDGNEITVPVGTMQVESGGKISVNGNLIAQVGVYVPTDNNGQFVKEGTNLYSVTGGTRALDDSPIEASSLEGSNVNVVESMLDMIRIGRQFELSQKTIQQQDDLLQRLIASLNER